LESPVRGDFISLPGDLGHSISPLLFFVSVIPPMFRPPNFPGLLVVEFGLLLLSDETVGPVRVRLTMDFFLLVSSNFFSDSLVKGLFSKINNKG
jgi:hypothetical protein